MPADPRARARAGGDPLERLLEWVAPSSRICRDSDQVGKWTWESVKPGRTQRPPRSTTSGVGERRLVCPDAAGYAVACDRERARHRKRASIVRTTPFSRIIGGDSSDDEVRRCIDHVGSQRAGLRDEQALLRRRRSAVFGYGVVMEFPRCVRRLRTPGDPELLDRPAASRSAPGRTSPSRAPTGATVDAFHEAALAAGGTDNGPPGIRDALPRALLRCVRPRSRRQQRRGRLPHTSTTRLARALGRPDRRAAGAPRPRAHDRARAHRAARGGDRRVARVPVGRRRALPRAGRSSASCSTRSGAARAPGRCSRSSRSRRSRRSARRAG